MAKGTKAPRQRLVLAVATTVEQAQERCRRVYAVVRTVSDNADQSIAGGISGSMRPNQLGQILFDVGVPGAAFCDLGCGVGRPVLAAWQCGARLAHGYELPGNAALNAVFECARARLPATATATTTGDSRSDPVSDPVACFSKDILDMDPERGELDRYEVVMAFWVGMPEEVSSCSFFQSAITQVQRHILRLCNRRVPQREARTLLLFKTRSYPKPEAVLAELGNTEFRHLFTRQVQMQGSGECKTAWAFREGF